MKVQNGDIGKQEEKKRLKEIKIWHGIIPVFISAIFLTRVIFELADVSFGIREYVLAYALAVISALFISAMLLFVITSLSALIIMLVNKIFNMQQLFRVNYNYYGKCILLNSVFMYLFLKFEDPMFMHICNISYYLFILFLLYRYYVNLIEFAYVNKWAARLLLGITIGINVLLVVLFRMK